MKRILTILSLAALSAIATASSPIDNIYENCQYVMTSSPNCAVAIDEKRYPPGGRTLMSPVGWVDNDVINEFRATGYTLGPDGKFNMCAMARTGCLEGLNAQKCKFARARWRSSPAPTLAEVWQRVYAFLASVRLA